MAAVRAMVLRASKFGTMWLQGDLAVQLAMVVAVRNRHEMRVAKVQTGHQGNILYRKLTIICSDNSKFHPTIPKQLALSISEQNSRVVQEVRLRQTTKTSNNYGIKTLDLAVRIATLISGMPLMAC